MSLEALFQPRSIAVIGASEKPTVGRRIVASLDRIGFTGRIYPVNPGYPTVLGHTCYANMAELPEAPDVAVFCLGNARVLGAFVAAAERGIKGAVIYDGGFAEQGGEGRRLQNEIEGICREANIACAVPTAWACSTRTIPARPICRSCAIGPDWPAISHRLAEPRVLQQPADRH